MNPATFSTPSERISRSVSATHRSRPSSASSSLIATGATGLGTSERSYRTSPLTGSISGLRMCAMLVTAAAAAVQPW